MTDTTGPISVIDVDPMGHGTAASALRAGIPTIVWHRAPGPTRDLAMRGARLATSAADAARRAAIGVAGIDPLQPWPRDSVGSWGRAFRGSE
jgi:hypothetical protein